jgi:hypothetical protein
MDGRGRSIEYVPMLLPPSVDVASDIEEYRSGYVAVSFIGEGENHRLAASH